MDTHKRVKNQILVSVCRGKISEGYDFMDDEARVVIIAGIPFPNVMDSKIIIKQEFYMKPSQKDSWMLDNSMMAVNQSLGRIIRHRHDFGSVFLVDQRYVYGSNHHSQTQ